MTLKQTRLVTADVPRLTRFYETVSQANAAVISNGYVEFHREPCEGLAIVDPAAIPPYGASRRPVRKDRRRPPGAHECVHDTGQVHGTR